MEKVQNYAWPITAVSKEDYTVILDCVRENKEKFEGKQILIFGAGIRGAEFSVVLEGEGYTNIVFTDNNKEKWGGVIDGYPIISVEEALNRRENVVYMISVEEGDSIRDQLLNAGLEENKDFYYPKADLYERFTEEFRRPMKDEILVMGDCMFEVISFYDKNKDSLSEIMQQQLGYENVKLLTMHGMGMPSFYHVLKGQLNCGYKPSVFVVMLNFETLTGKQHLLPRSQHTKLARMVSETAPDPDEELKRYAELTEERVKNVQAEFFTTNNMSSAKMSNNSKGKISDSASKVFFKLNYMYKLDTEMESIQYLREVLRMAKEKDFQVLPFVPPVNYQRGEELFGSAFEQAYSHNLTALTEVVEEEGFHLLDLSHICTRELFAHASTPDETTNYEGRTLVAKKICEELCRMEKNV
ncbi:MAG: hypothetical protein IJZ55_09710 [Lachnospiraceae bacterium]|nr:hypothetical protein [Lachnospiraceae bacterium]